VKEAEKLVDQKIHPQVIIDGYRLAGVAAKEALEKSAVDNGYTIPLFQMFHFSSNLLQKQP
jgi:chaperonin GroEL (HSP60 family)